VKPSGHTRSRGTRRISAEERISEAWRRAGYFVEQVAGQARGVRLEDVRGQVVRGVEEAGAEEVGVEVRGGERGRGARRREG